jgi:hypothetical protein
MIQSEKVKPSRIEECSAHYKYVLDWKKEDFIVGKVVAVSSDKKNYLIRKKNRKIIVESEVEHQIPIVQSAIQKNGLVYINFKINSYFHLIFYSS